MLLFEAKEELQERLTINKRLLNTVPEYKEALEIAIKCIDSQIKLADNLNIIGQEKRTVLYTADEVYEILEECFYDESQIVEVVYGTD